MDTSANELLKALNHAGAVPALAKTISVHAGPPAPSDTPLGRRNWSLMGRFLPASASPRAAFHGVILIALSLALAGCDVPQPATTNRLIPPSRTDTKGAQQLASPTPPPEAPPKPAPPAPPPAPQPPLRVSGVKPPPATLTRGAEQLAAPVPPAPVPVSQSAPLPPDPPDPPAPQTPPAPASVTVTSAPVPALIVRGSPPEPPSRRAVTKLLGWLGLGVGVAALAVLARLYLLRRVTPAELLAAGKDEVELPKELLLKEPLSLPPEPVTPEKS